MSGFVWFWHYKYLVNQMIFRLLYNGVIQNARVSPSHFYGFKEVVRFDYLLAGVFESYFGYTRVFDLILTVDNFEFFGSIVSTDNVCV